MNTKVVVLESDAWLPFVMAPTIAHTTRHIFKYCTIKKKKISIHAVSFTPKKHKKPSDCIITRTSRTKLIHMRCAKHTARCRD